MFKKMFYSLLFFLGFVKSVFASIPTWTPLIQASDFNGIRIDVTTACVGILGILIIIVAVALLKRAFTN
jgi:uncharacterized iron-regulated protein